MICKEVHKKHNSYLNGELDPKEKMAFQEHINACPSCNSLIQEVNKTMNIADKNKALTADPFMYTRIQQQIAKNSSPVNGMWERVFQPIAALAIVFIGLTIGIGLGSKFYDNTIDNGIKDTELQSMSNEIYFDVMEYESLEAFLLKED